MTSSKASQPRSAWTSNPLLGQTPQTQAPRFLRSPWDEPSAQDFGPWRISPKPDPAESQSTPAAVIRPANETYPEVFAETAVADHAAVEHGDENALPTASMSTPADPTISQPLAEPDPAKLKVAEEAAFKRGLIAGRQQELQALRTQREEERELIRNLTIELRGLQQQPERFFEPLKKLALHLAETLVRNELQTSEKAINALIEACISQLDPSGEPVMVSLNPTDLEHIQALGEPINGQLRLHADPALRPGSVRAQVQDSMVQDLIEHRLEALARKILSDPQAWLQRSTLLHDVVDAMPDDTPQRVWDQADADVIDVPSQPEEPEAS